MCILPPTKREREERKREREREREKEKKAKCLYHRKMRKPSMKE